MRTEQRVFYGWYIVGIAFFIMSIAYAIWYAFPVFYVPILEEFGWSRAETASIVSVGFVTYGIGSLIGGALLDRLGPRKTFTRATVALVVGLVGSSRANAIWQFLVFWGGFTAFGVSAVGFVPCNTLVSRWFVRRRGTAVGIAQAGGRESFLTTPAVQFLILTIGWRGTMLVLAAIAFAAITGMAQFLRNSPQDMGLLPDGASEAEQKENAARQGADRLVVAKEWASTDWTLGKAMKHYRLWALLFTSLSTGVGMSIVMTHQVAHIVDIGFTAMLASFLLLIFGVFSMAGRLSGIVSDKIGREPTYTLASVGVALAYLILTLTGYTQAVWMLYAYIVVFGFFSGLNGPTLVSGGADIFQGQNLGAILGFTNIGYGLGNSFGAWFGGYVFDRFETYTFAFIVAMLMSSLACTFYWIASPRRVRIVAGRAPRTTTHWRHSQIPQGTEASDCWDHRS